ARFAELGEKRPGAAWQCDDVEAGGTEDVGGSLQRVGYDVPSSVWIEIGGILVFDEVGLPGVEQIERARVGFGGKLDGNPPERCRRQVFNDLDTDAGIEGALNVGQCSHDEARIGRAMRLRWRI